MKAPLIRCALLLAASLAAMASSTPAAPEPDSCDEPDDIALLTLDLGPNDDPFRAWMDGDAVQVVGGGQGSDMIGVRLRMTSPRSISCIDQDLLIEFADGTSARQSVALNVYPQADGAYATSALWTIIDGRPVGSGVVVTVAAGGLEISRTLTGPAPPPPPPMPTPESVSFDPPSVTLVAGETGIVSVVLDAPAPAGGTTFALEGPAVNASFGPEVTIPAGQTRATVRIVATATGVGWITIPGDEGPLASASIYVDAEGAPP